MGGEHVRKYYQKYPEKRLAHRRFREAIKDGRISKEPCRICGNDKSEGHHEDYNKPLDVVWLCRDHHKRWHYFKNRGATDIAKFVEETKARLPKHLRSKTVIDG